MEFIEDCCAFVSVKLNGRRRLRVKSQAFILHILLQGHTPTLPEFKVFERVLLGTDDVVHRGGVDVR